MISIRPAEAEEAAWLEAEHGAVLGGTKPAGYFQSVIEMQARGELVLLIAAEQSSYLGHCRVAWKSDYPRLRAQNIPEIQDLNVRPDFQRRGIGSALLDEAERHIAERATLAGIGFGLYADYGAAQRLYVKRGYVPDGCGVHYRLKAAVAGEAYRLDDDLVLYLVKRL